MRITVTNKTSNSISTDIGLIGPLAVVDKDIDPADLYKISGGLSKLESLGYISVLINDTAALNDKYEVPIMATSEAITLYVNVNTGSDSNSGVVSAPFKTIQAALNSLPYIINHPVTINVAAGTYSEALVPPSFTLNNNIIILGGMSAFTPTTGVSTGTFDASFTGQDFAHTAVLTGAGWTVDDLKGGVFVEILDGSAAGFFLPIVINTATTITVSTQADGTGGSGIDLRGRQFRLVKPNVIIQSSITARPTLAMGSVISGQSYNPDAPSTTGTGYWLSFQQVEFRRLSTIAIRVYNNSYLHLRYCNIIDSTAGGSFLIDVRDGSYFRLDYSLAYRSALVNNTNMITARDSSYLSLNRYGCYGGNFAMFAENNSTTICTFGFFYGQDVSASGSRDTFSSLSGVGIKGSFGGVSSGYNSRVELFGCKIKDCTYHGVGVGNSGFASLTTTGLGHTAASIYLSNTIIDNCVTGVKYLDSLGSVMMSGTTQINNCTSMGVNFVPALRASHNVLVMRNTISMTGNAVDLSLDGSASTTLAALRAAPNKAMIDSTYFNRMMEEP